MTENKRTNSAGADAIETREWWNRSTGCSSTAGRSGSPGCSRTSRSTPGWPASSCPSRHHPLHQHHPGRTISRLIRATGRSNGASRASSAGMRWRWSCGPIRGGRHRRAHLDLCLCGHPVRGRLQPFLPRQGRTLRRRPDLLPGPRLARNLRARLPRRPVSTEEHLAISAASCAGHGGGLSSYPHPWLMPDFWEFPTVSMGLARSWPSTRPGSTTTSRIAVCTPDRPQGLGLSRGWRDGRA